MRRPRRSARPAPDPRDDRAKPQSDAREGLPGEGPSGGAPSDGDHNQGGARPEGLDYQRDLGVDQDA